MRRIGETVVWLAVPAAMLVAVVSVIGLISEVVGVVQQTPVQRGIDAHRERVTAAYADYDNGSKTRDATYTLAYVYRDETYTVPLRSLPGDPAVGDPICAEIDAEQPQNVRACGTRGNLTDAQHGLRTGGVILGVALLFLLAVRAYHRSAESRPARSTPARHPAGRRSRRTSRNRRAR